MAGQSGHLKLDPNSPDNPEVLESNVHQTLLAAPPHVAHAALCYAAALHARVRAASRATWLHARCVVRRQHLACCGDRAVASVPRCTRRQRAQAPSRARELARKVARIWRVSSRESVLLQRPTAAGTAWCPTGVAWMYGCTAVQRSVAPCWCRASDDVGMVGVRPPTRQGRVQVSLW